MEPGGGDGVDFGGVVFGDCIEQEAIGGEARNARDLKN
jgi:hypothetical protein